MDFDKSIRKVGLFRSFNDLSSPEYGGFEKGRDFYIDTEDRNSFVAVIGIHAGKIEKMTSEIVRTVAGADLSYYLFESNMPRYNSALHISSHDFDEVSLIRMLTNTNSCVSIHGYKEDKKSEVSMGGMNKNLAKLIFKNIHETGLIEQDIMAPRYKNLFHPEAPSNIANKSKAGGVQIEVSKRLRQRLHDDRYMLETFSTAIREAIFTYSESVKPRLIMPIACSYM